MGDTPIRLTAQRPPPAAPADIPAYHPVIAGIRVARHFLAPCTAVSTYVLEFRIDDAMAVALGRRFRAMSHREIFPVLLRFGGSRGPSALPHGPSDIYLLNRVRRARLPLHCAVGRFNFAYNAFYQEVPRRLAFNWRGFGRLSLWAIDPFS